MAIQRLPGNVAAQVQSSVAIASLNATVLGLLRNALDAGARRVAVSVDYSLGACVVDDNGAGIAPVEFSASGGGLGKAHHTSKFPPSPGLHGRHGTFLASVASLALLTVVSRCSNHGTAQALTMHNGRVLRRHAPARLDLSAAVSPTPHGTRVSVHDLFGCMPVRARQRPTAASDTSLSLAAATARDWDELVRSTIALLLAWPHDVAVLLCDESGSISHAQRRRVLGRRRAPAADDDHEAARLRIIQLFAQAGLCSSTTDDAPWVPVSASADGIAVSGFVCREPAASKQAQFLHIGVQPLTENHHADVLYDEINRIFAASEFGAGTNVEASARGQLDRFVRVKRPRKAVDQWPVFSIGIDFVASDAVAVDDVLDDRRQYLTVLKRLLRAMLESFLSDYGFYGRPAHPGSRHHSQLASPRRRQATVDRHGRTSGQSQFLSWPRTKYAERQPQKRLEKQLEPHPLPIEKEDTSRFFSGVCCHDDDDRGEDGSEDGSDACAGHLPLFPGEEQDGDAFRSGSIRLSRPCLEHATVIGQVDSKFILIRVPVSPRNPDPGVTDTTDTVSPSAETVLVLVDQHAADERCRVEELFRGYFRQTPSMGGVAQTTRLAQPLQFELAADEAQLAARFRGVFSHWGVVYDVAADLAAGPETALLRVHRLPTSLAARCAQEPQLVADLIRGEVWARSTASQRAQRMPSQGRSPAVEGPGSWVSLFHGCPRGLVNLLHSKACRSAIKFNDTLSHEACVGLVKRLLHCSFPFQCAHGRPSMVPLLNLGPETPFDSRPGTTGNAWEEYDVGWMPSPAFSQGT